jgi:23S rRNA pseudouridine1911/1915/1917 synthase
MRSFVSELCFAFGVIAEQPTGSHRMRILYEDSALIFLDKPPGLVVQRGYDAEEPVLLEMVEKYLREKGESAFLMQRLDRGTSGVIFFSKLASINRNLTRQFERKSIRKHYVALVHGRISVPQTIDAPLLRIGPISFGVRDEGKRAVTHLAPRESADRATVVDIDLETGRTHQIRVHLSAIGHPLVGDWLYGARDAARPMLHAASLSMLHPQTGEALVVSASLPDDFVEEASSRGLTDIRRDAVLDDRLSSRPAHPTGRA